MNWLTIGIRLVPMIVGAIQAVERLIKGKGKEKEDAAVVMVEEILRATEIGLNRDLLKDSEVSDATRKVVQAVVSLQNIIARKGE